MLVAVAVVLILEGQLVRLQQVGEQAAQLLQVVLLELLTQVVAVAVQVEIIMLMAVMAVQA
jgi:hypothetical protein